MKYLAIIILLITWRTSADVTLPDSLFAPLDPATAVFPGGLVGGHESGGFTLAFGVQFGYSLHNGEINEEFSTLVRQEAATSLNADQINAFVQKNLSQGRKIECAHFKSLQGLYDFEVRLSSELKRLSPLGPAVQIRPAWGCL